MFNPNLLYMPGRSILPIARKTINWAFPNIAYQMIVTGEKTGQLGLMMEKVADYYAEEHINAITRIKALIEPLMIIFLAVVVGGIYFITFW